MREWMMRLLEKLAAQHLRNGSQDFYRPGNQLLKEFSIKLT